MDKDKANVIGSKKALVIAVSDYDDSSNLKSIAFRKNDGNEIYNVLKRNGYDILDNHKLIGYVNSEILENAIYDFFTDEYNKPDDTLIFYYSGYGVPDNFNEIFLAPSNIDSDRPFKMGFSFDFLTKSMLASNSQKIITILDICYSHTLKISKGLDKDSASRIANAIIEEKSEILKQEIGRCLLAANQGYEEAYDTQQKDHSIFTYYLLEGLKGHKNAVDDEGNLTYTTLGNFITQEIRNLSPEERPKQKLVRKGEIAGEDIVLLRKESDYFTLIKKAKDYYYHGKYHEALECYNSIIKIQPKNDNALLWKGYILSLLKENKKAIECYDELIKRNIFNADAWYFKAQSLSKLEDYENALKCLDEASKINPNDKRVLQIYEEIKPLMKSFKEKQSYEIQKVGEITKKNKIKIFVSYSRTDAADFANQIQKHLSSFKYDIFTDVDSIRAGEIWSNTIEENISNCDIFVIIVTDGTLYSPYVENEVLQAQRENKKIIPCFFRSVRRNKIKWGLEKIQGVEFDDKYELARNLYSKIDIEN